MIFLAFLEIYLINNKEYTLKSNIFDSSNSSTDILQNNTLLSDNDYIKEIIIICTFGTLIYLVLHQVNQVAGSSFKFCMYNKVLICIMIIDIIICLFFVSKYLVNYGVSFITPLDIYT